MSLTNFLGFGIIKVEQGKALVVSRVGSEHGRSARDHGPNGFGLRNGKTKNFVVPVLDCSELTPKELMSGRVQELMAARAAGAVAGRLQAAAITAGPSRDYPSLIDAAKSRDALVDLHKQAVADYRGQVPNDLLAEFTARAEAIKAAHPVADSPAAAPDDASDDPVGAVWADIMAESPWDTAEELEQHFCQLVGHSSGEASLEDMHKFLAAVRKAKTQGAAA